jgi:formate dehydrogenase subunit gamma
MTTRILPALLLAAGLLSPALAQQTQQAPGLPGGDPAVQSMTPEVGAGRGGPNNNVPETSEPQQPTGGPAPAVPNTTAPHAPTPTQELVAPPPFTSRPEIDAAEMELQRQLRGGVIGGAVSIPNQSAGILIQPEGRDWRVFRSTTLVVVGAVAVLGMLLVLTAFYLLKGSMPIEAGRSGRTIHRYGLLERANHWMVAGSFVLLALTGLNITFGAFVLRPVIGPEAFTALTLWAQAVHQYISFAFTLGLLVMLALWAWDNLPSRVDVDWLRAGGPLAKGHPPAGRFNAAQKALFWFAIGGGVLAAASGYLLMFPYLLDNVGMQQWAHIAHGLLAMVLIAAILGHIYIGTVGTEGAFEGMYQGVVDYNYAREHHSLWTEEQLAKARGSVLPAPANDSRRAAAE